MKRGVVVLLFSLILSSFAGAATAQTVSCKLTDPVPCKRIRIYNNNPASGNTIYAFIQAPKISNDVDKRNADSWMQAQFKITDWDSSFFSPRTFTNTRLRRAYIEITNAAKGIPPGGWVEITIPFYTKLKATTAANLGKAPDQFIDWWNAARIYLFDSAAAYHSAKVTNNNDKPPAPGGGLPPPKVKVFAGAAVPTCKSSDGAKCTVPLFEYAINPPNGIPFQLQEYTFASAEGPPLNTKLPPPTRTKIERDFVNYNVSSLDSVFMPVAMGPLTAAGDSVNKETGKPVPYVGTALSTTRFRQTLDKFSSSGNNWPFYVPAYYDDEIHPGFPSSTAEACSLAPFTTNSTGRYNLPKVPGAFDLLDESYKGAQRAADGSRIDPPAPPVLSSNPANYRVKYRENTCSVAPPPPFVNPPNLGEDGKSMTSLWHTCTKGASNTTATCKDIRTVARLFNDSYLSNGCTQTPPFYITMRAVYGWVPIVYKGCSGVDLKTNNALYRTAALAYCRLQYNYVTLPPGQRAVYTFNPYAAMIHAPYSPVAGGGTESSAYAFSIDDKLSFKHVIADGVIITIAGAKGLEFDRKSGQTAPVPTSIPETAKQIADHCKLD